MLVLARYLLIRPTRMSGRAAALGTCAFAASLLAQETISHQYYVRSSLLTFIDTPTRHTPYPQDWLAQHANDLRPGQNLTCHPARAPLGATQAILVIVESLSSYHSQAFGGIHNWTPELDRWSHAGWKFERFLANGKATEDGLYALFTGRNPIPAPGLDSIYAQPLDHRSTLPGVLSRHGFHTAFLTSGDLGFMQKGHWLRRAGFDEIEGHDAPFYEGHQRYHFSAAKDDVLYDRALQWIADHRESKYLLSIETVSSHQPYYDPVHNRISTEGAFRYADAALGRFIQRLQATGFLENGLLIVTSDHRAMIPASGREKAHMGARHLSRIPLLILGKGIKADQKEQAFTYSQQYLLPSLTSMLTEETVCTSRWQGMFAPGYAAPAACIASSRAPQPDSIFLQCKKRDLEIQLDADHTRYVHGTRGNPAYLRLTHEQRTEEMQEATP